MGVGLTPVTSESIYFWIFLNLHQPRDGKDETTDIRTAGSNIGGFYIEH